MIDYRYSDKDLFHLVSKFLSSVRILFFECYQIPLKMIFHVIYHISLALTAS